MNGIGSYKSYAASYQGITNRAGHAKGKDNKTAQASRAATEREEKGASAAEAKNTNSKSPAVNKAGATDSPKEVKLSSKAKAMLEELKKKYSNMDFTVAYYDTDEEAQAYLSQGTKEYSVLMDPDTLEEMANDESVREKYEGVLKQAGTKLDEVKEQLGDEADRVKNLGISIDKNGGVSFFAELEKSSEAQKERIEKTKEKKKEQEKTENKKAEKNEGQEQAGLDTKRIIVKADTIEDLVKKIKKADFPEVKQEAAGINFDLKI